MNNFSYGRGAQSQEIDYGDIPETMNEDQMRAYLTMESKLVMPNQKKRDSFEQQWNNGRQQINQQQQPQQQPPQNQQQPPSSFSPSPPQPKSAQFVASPQNHGYSQNTNTRSNNDKSIAAASAYSHASDYDPNVIDRMSTVTIISQKGNHRREHSFAKQPVKKPYQHNYNNPNVNQNGANHMNMNNGQQYNKYNNHGPFVHQQQHMEPTPKSALTAQISPQKHLNGDSGQQSGVIQSRNPEGKLVVKQMPYSKKTHVCVNIFVEISSEHIEHVIVYFNKHLSVAQFLDLLKNETNNAAFKDTELEIWCADDDGDIEDDFPPPEQTAIIANLGLDNFYIKIKGANEAERDDIRRSTMTYKDQLLSTKEVDKMHSLNEDEEDEDEYEDDEYEEDGGCKCIIL